MRMLAGSIGLIAIMMLMASCGVSDRTLTEAENRVNSLKSKGVPDSSLSLAKVYLYQARDAKHRGNRGLASKSADSMRVLIAEAEGMYTDKIASLRPAVDSLRSLIRIARGQFTGMQLRKIDSTTAIADSFVNIGWLLQAHSKGQEIIAALPALRFDESRAKELRERIPGEWVCINITKSQEDKNINAVEKKIFAFQRDGKVKLVENKRGQSGPYLKEDWEFVSWGSYDLAGDTIVLRIDRFAALKQDFQRLNVEDGKKVWKNEPAPTYDSLITDGSQDRYITFMDLKEDFKQDKTF